MRMGNRTGETPVQVSIAVPVGWFYKENFTLLAPYGESNVILSSEPLDESITGEEYAHIQGELLEREFPGYSEISYEDFALGDEGVAKLRVFEWMPPDGSFPVTQAQLYYVLSARGITSTATTSSVNLAKIKSTLLDVLRSIVLIGDPVPDAVET